jgi:hypothetical protein
MFVQNLHIDTLKIAISYLKSCSMSAIGRNSFPLRPPHRRQTLQRIQACVRRNHARTAWPSACRRTRMPKRMVEIGRSKRQAALLFSDAVR